jgi:uncharacterized protein
MKNPICSILWRDAAYSYEEYNPDNLPKPILTTGFIIENNTEKGFTKIASSSGYDAKEGKVFPKDGFLIPNGMEIEFKKLADLKRVQVTFDGFRKEHDKSRFSSSGPSFDKIIANIAKIPINKKLPFVDVRINLSKHNFQSAKKLIRYLHEMGFSNKVSLTIGLIENYGDKCTTCPREDIDLDTANRYLNLVLTANKLGFEIQKEFAAGPICFAQMKHSVVIKPDGAMQKCFCSVGVSAYDFSNIKSDVTETKALYDQRFSILNNKIVSCIDEECPFIPICNGGCTWRALYKDPILGHITRTCNKTAMQIINEGLIKKGIY